MKKTPSRCRLFLALALACACAQAQVGVSPRFDADYVLSPRGTQPDGSVRVHDYGAFALWRIDAAGGKRLPRAERRIDLPSGWFVPRADDAKRATPPGATGIYVVQFVGPIVDEWLADLRRAGAQPLQYVGEDAYLVVADAKAGAALAQAAERGEPMRYSAPLAADRKIAPDVAQYAEAHPLFKVVNFLR